MKQVFFILLLLFSIAIIGLFIFLLTFDANKFKPLVTEKIEKAINKDVRIGNISLNILPAISFRIDGLTIKDLDKTWEDALLQVGSVELNLKPLPLIKKDIQIEHLNIKGLNLNITEGHLSAMGRTTVAEGHKDVDSGLLAAGALKFLAKSITIINSNIDYSDFTSGRPVSIKVDIIEAFLKNVSAYGPVDISARASLFGRGKENIKLNAMLYPEFETKRPFLKNLGLYIDLSNVDLNKVFDILGNPNLVRNSLDEEIEGKLILGAEKILLDPDTILDSNINITLSDGVALVKMPIRGNFKDIELKAGTDHGDVKLQKLTGRVAGGDFFITGTIKDILMQQRLDLVGELHGVDIALVQPDIKTAGPRFEGILNIEMVSSARGVSLQRISETFQAEGSISIKRPVLRNINILTKALDRLDMLPGLVDGLKRRLPEHYKDLLSEDYTAFKPIDVRFRFKDKRLFFPEAVIESDAFYLVANGYFSIDGDIVVDSDLFIPQDLSNAFIDAVHEFKYLQNSQGMITMPLSIQGRFPNISVMPDLDYVIQRLAVSKGQELIEGIFKKDLPIGVKKAPPDEGQGTTDEETEAKQEGVEPAEAILRGIFDIITRPRE